MKRLFVFVILAANGWAAPTPAADKADIDKAIERGVKGLLSLQRDGSWPDPEGMTALAGVTLLECDVPRSDPVIQKAAEHVRRVAIRTEQVYTVCTAIFFLDLLDDPVDVPLLEALTVRLLSGQWENGGWGYKTEPIPDGEVQRLDDYYQKSKENKPAPVKKPRTVRDLAPETQQRLLQIRPNATRGDSTDHSNTQFSILATWVGRRYGVPVDGALALVDARFRTKQNVDGGWGYHLDEPSSPAMTCAGVLGLSVAHGMVLMTGKPLGPNARPHLDPVRDLSLKNALARIALNVDVPPSVKKVTPPRLVGHDIYFLWSLERIMVAMDQERIGGKDWYNWGVELLLANQQEDGRWSAEHGSNGADTCFALLFLRRANLASDLTATLKSKAGDFVLKAGGVLDREPLPSTEPKKPSASETSPPRQPNETTPSKLTVETRPVFTQPQSARLAESLVRATSANQSQILEQMRDGKGVEYTEALAGAIPKLSADGKRKARNVLAERLTRMKPEILARYLRDDDVEIRRASALATGTREFKDHVPLLIELLADSDQGVVLSAHTALKAMTGQNLPASVEPWRLWWKQQEKK